LILHSLFLSVLVDLWASWTLNGFKSFWTRSDVPFIYGADILFTVD